MDTYHIQEWPMSDITKVQHGIILGPFWMGIQNAETFQNRTKIIQNGKFTGKPNNNAGISFSDDYMISTCYLQNTITSLR